MRGSDYAPMELNNIRQQNQTLRERLNLQKQVVGSITPGSRQKVEQRVAFTPHK